MTLETLAAALSQPFATYPTVALAAVQATINAGVVVPAAALTAAQDAVQALANITPPTVLAAIQLAVELQQAVVTQGHLFGRGAGV